ncbi:MAG TPA: cytochrome c [Anaeromyxobacteraceae bacterium]|jgi:mono/diheme cytochrome c family protein|nr:cytochrome c [Anaeromyxobacteraceae bacterium]
MRFFAGVTFTLLLLGVGAGALLASGAIDMSATRPPMLVERLAGEALLDRSLARRAPKVKNPLAPAPEVLAAGLELYRHDCLGCHGAPGVSPGPWGVGLNPPPTNLAAPGAQESTDGELFQIVARGVRMTGMPAWAPSHQERELWELVAFVRHLPQLTAAEKQALKEAARAARR